MSTPDLEKIHRHVAVHEAGHAVVGLALGLEVVGVLLNLTDKGGNGFTVFDDGSTQDPEKLMRRHPEKMGPTLFAGTCAERELLKSAVPDGQKVDLEILSRCLPMRYDPADAIPAMRAKAEELIAQHRSEISALADSLIRNGRSLDVEIASLRSRVRP